MDIHVIKLDICWNKVCSCLILYCQHTLNHRLQRKGPFHDTHEKSLTLNNLPPGLHCIMPGDKILQCCSFSCAHFYSSVCMLTYYMSTYLTAFKKVPHYIPTYLSYATTLLPSYIHICQGRLSLGGWFATRLNYGKYLHWLSF